MLVKVKFRYVYVTKYVFALFQDLLRAGTVDGLIVLATQSHKNDFLYQEAFLATYRTFVSTHDLLEKLVYRFRRFSSSSKKVCSKQNV